MANQQVSGGKVTDFAKSKLLWIILALCAVVLWWYFDGRERFASRDTFGTPSVGGRDVGETSSATQVIKVKLDPVKWSEWVELPMVFKTAEFDAPGQLEFCFQNGAKKRLMAGENLNWKNIPCATFKLRGAAGEATIAIRF